MLRNTWIAGALMLTLVVSVVAAQNYDGAQGSGTRNTMQSVGVGGIYRNDCGRELTTAQAAALWGNYCNETCGLQCGHRCGASSCFKGCFHRRLHGASYGGCQGVSDIEVSSDVACDAGSDCGSQLYTSVDYGGHRHGGGFLRRLFSRLGHHHGGGCYQGCFGYPGRMHHGSGVFGHARHCGHHGCRLTGGLLHHVFHGGGQIKSRTCCALGKVRGLLGRIKSRLAHHHCLFSRPFHRIGCQGNAGGYFVDAPFTTSHNFGFYSQGCGCDALVDQTVDQGMIESGDFQPAPKPIDMAPAALEAPAAPAEKSMEKSAGLGLLN